MFVSAQRLFFLDLVTDMTKEAFIASLHQFTALYGVPEHVYTDNGSNFIGANKELSVLRELLCSSVTQYAIHHLSFTKGLQWHFIPSRAPHFGGLWEAVVKVMKTLLKKVVGSHILRTDEFQTLLFEASAVMNSHPLVPVDSQPADGIEPLTPRHFLHGSGPPHDTSAAPTTTYGKRWRLNQYLANELWTRWKKEYLVLLQ